MRVLYDPSQGCFLLEKQALLLSYGERGYAFLQGSNYDLRSIPLILMLAFAKNVLSDILRQSP